MTTAPSAGGVLAASCKPLKPLHDVPTMPTLPSHHGCSASQAMTSRPSSQLLLGVLVLDDPAGIPGPADVDAGTGVAVGREPAHLLMVPRLRPVAQPVGQVLEDRRHAAGALGQPQPRGEAGAVRQGNPFRLDHPQRVREVVAHARGHGARLDGRGLTSRLQAESASVRRLLGPQRRI